MSRYIDADALDKAFSKLRFNNDGELNHYGDRPNWYLWGSEIENLIADAPYIDIVRCKECRHRVVEEQSWGEYNEYCDLWCDGNGYWASVNADDFCSYGERESE